MANECDSIQIKYSGDGTRVLFPFPFPYMSYDDIVCFLYNESSETWENQANKFIFANATTVEFLTAPPAPTELGFENVWITRNTDIERMIATFYPGSSIRAQDLNDDFDQLRLAIQEGRCELERSLNELDENTWNKDEAFTEDDQVNARWVAADDEKLATSDAIIARHDSYVQPNVPPTVTYQQTGKTWQNTEECWTSYWQNSVDGQGNDSETWVAYVNTGPRGEQGPAGPPGQSIVGPPPGLQDPAAIATNVPPKAPGVIGDATADVVQDPDSLDIQFTFGIPEGAAASVDAGTTTTGAPGTDAEVVNSGTLNAAIFDFTIPRGDKGETGDKGDKADPVVTVSDIAPKDPDQGDIWFDSKNAEAFFYYCDGDSCQWISLIKPGPPGPPGEDGEDGADGSGIAATVDVGTTTTGAPGSNALVSNSGNSQNAVFNFTIPRGDKGEDGDEGAAATIAVGTVDTVEPDEPATVTNSGDVNAAVFDFEIPKGEKGDTGESFTSVVSDDAPENPENGDAWFNSNVGRLFIYYTDGSSAQWVQA